MPGVCSPSRRVVSKNFTSRGTRFSSLGTKLYSPSAQAAQSVQLISGLLKPSPGLVWEWCCTLFALLQRLLLLSCRVGGEEPYTHLTGRMATGSSQAS